MRGKGAAGRECAATGMGAPLGEGGPGEEAENAYRAA